MVRRPDRTGTNRALGVGMSGPATHHHTEGAVRTALIPDVSERTTFIFGQIGRSTVGR